MPLIHPKEFAASSRALCAGSPVRRIAAFALPILAGDFLHTFYTIADAYVIGRWLGIEGLAAAGVGTTLVRFVFGVVIGISAGSAVIVAQRVGARDETGIRRSVAAGLSICFYASVALTASLLPLGKPIISLMRAPPELAGASADYARVILAGLSSFMFYNMLAGIIRAGGDSFSPFLFLLAGTFCNCVLDVVFVAVFSWGIRGAAAATVISESVSLFLALRFLIRRFPRFLPKKRDWFAAQRELGLCFSQGIAMALQRSIVEIGNILVQAATNGLGSLAIAAVSAGQRVRAVNMMPLFALSQTMVTYTAQNFGAKKMDRVYRGLFDACLISLGLGVFMAALNRFFGAPLAALFLNGNPEAIALATRFILFTGYAMFILGLMLVFRSVLQGLGARGAPILCGAMETAMSVLASFALIPRFGFTGVCLVNPLSWLASGIPLYLAFALLRKKKRARPPGLETAP